MKLLLTSNGLTSPELEQAFIDLTLNRKGLKIGVIHTASDPINWLPSTDNPKKFLAVIDETRIENNKVWLESYLKSWADKGHEATPVGLKKDPAEVRAMLEKVDVIDVTGGDVNYLIDWAKKCRLGDYLKSLLERGVVYMGASAGCGLPVPDIGLTWWEPTDDSDRIGFGIVDFGVVPHQKETDERSNEANLIRRKKYMQSLVDYPWRIYLLQDGQAVKVDGEKVEHIGPGVKKWI